VDRVTQRANRVADDSASASSLPTCDNGRKALVNVLWFVQYGALFRRRWRTGKTNRASTSQLGTGSAGPLAIVSVTMDWLLSFTRAQTVLSELTDPDYLLSSNVQALMQCRVEAMFRATNDREALWNLFHISIHEYLHLLANDKWFEYAYKQDDARSNVLVEGFCDFLTLNVRASLKITPHLRKQVEGPYYDGKAPLPEIDPGVYAQHAQAEHVVAVVGIHNALAAYFKGEVELIGGP
jgi:hypothetical protein